jgi:hypothetical protein
MADMFDKEELGIVSSLFGVSPAMQNKAMQQAAYKRGTEAGQNLLGGVLGNVGMFSEAAGQGLRGGLGVQTPEERMMGIRQQAQQQFDTNTPQGLLQMADFLNSQGDAAGARQAVMLAQGQQQRMSTLQKTQFEGAGARAKVINEQKLREELTALGPNASQDQILAVVSRYGSPDAVLRTLQASQDRQALITSRENMASEKASEKKAEKEAKLSQNQEMAIGAVDRVINEVKEARPLVGRLTAGFGGSSLSAIPGTEARDLQAKLTTIKANLGFDRLQQMRDASPTGGALGQVAVQELVALQSTVASLDQAQSPKQLRDALDKIESHYTKWRATVRKAGGQEQPTPAPTPGAPQAPIYATNPSTKQRIMSTDGGKTWNPVGGR